MDEEKALSDLLCDLSARDGAAEAETVFRCQMWQKVAAVLPGVNFNLCGKARQGQGAQSPAYGRQLPPAPQAQVAEVPNGVWPACSRGRRSVRGIELPTGTGKAGRIGLRHGPAGGKQAGTAGQKAAGPLHAQAMVQKLQRGALGPGVDAVVADGYHRQAVLPGQTEGNPVGKNGPSRGLIGGASLVPEKFVKIIEAANQPTL